MSRNNKLVLSLSFVACIIIWSRYGNFKEIIEKYGVTIVSILCIGILLYLLLYQFLSSRFKSVRLLLLVVLSVIPVINLLRITFIDNATLIIYCATIITIGIVFRENLLHLLKKYWIRIPEGPQCMLRWSHPEWQRVQEYLKFQPTACGRVWNQEVL